MDHLFRRVPTTPHLDAIGWRNTRQALQAEVVRLRRIMEEVVSESLSCFKRPRRSPFFQLAVEALGPEWLEKWEKAQVDARIYLKGRGLSVPDDPEGFYVIAGYLNPEHRFRHMLAEVVDTYDTILSRNLLKNYKEGIKRDRDAMRAALAGLDTKPPSTIVDEHHRLIEGLRYIHRKGCQCEGPRSPLCAACVAFNVAFAGYDVREGTEALEFSLPRCEDCRETLPNHLGECLQNQTQKECREN